MTDSPFGSVADTFRQYVAEPDSLKALSGFPYTEYSDKVSEYEEWESWWDGSKLDQQQESAGKQVDKYPVRVNPLYGACMKHAYALFGEVQMGHRPLVVPKLYQDKEADKEVAEAGERALNLLWWENQGRASMQQNGILSQVYGGCVWKVSYRPWTKKSRQIPVGIEAIHPRHFFGIPEAGDPWRLREGWIVKVLTHEEARSYGVPVDEGIIPLWIEKWTNDEYQIRINDELINPGFMPAGWKPQGANTLGFVPIVYIPHLRSTKWWGDSLIPNLVGLVKELNMRVADLGDAVSDDAHKILAMRNVTGTPRQVMVLPGVPAIDLGSSPNITGNEAQPDLFEAGGSTRATSVMTAATDRLYLQFRRDAFLPAVADGEDEGSQRSAMTLNVRFWPLLSHITMERWNWEAGLNLLDQYALKIMAAHNLAGVTEVHTKIPIYQDWAPVLPRDREQLVAEVVQRASAQLGSPEHLLTLLGDTAHPEDEVERSIEWVEALAKAQAKAFPQGTPNGRNPNATPSGNQGKAT